MRMSSPRSAWALAAAVLVAVPSVRAESDWIQKSNAYSARVLEVQARYGPEGAASLGVDGLDDQILDLRAGLPERYRADLRALVAELEAAREAESDVRVRQDLDILIGSQRDAIASSEIDQKFMLPYFNLAQGLFFGFQSLLDPQNDPARYPAAVTRLKRYAGLEEGYEPIVDLARARTLEGLARPELVGPFVAELDQHLGSVDKFVAGIRDSFERSGVEGWQEPFETLAGQLRGYYQWLDQTVRPRARQQPQLPPEVYADNLKNFGVDVPPEALIERATLAFADLQGEMQALAPLVAREHGFEGASDYRDVIRRLKEDRVPGDQVVAFYKDTLARLEQIIAREHLVSLPERDADIEIADAARSAAIPAPHLKPPRLIGNTGEYPIFMIPTIGRNEDGTWKTSDTTFKANAWTLTAHEARPGHELQFSSMIEAGVSTARAVFAFNSANVEGWALYAEAISRPYMPLDGQLISLQNRLLRAARMFLDPMINLGLTTREDAKRVLMEDVLLDDGFAQSEVDRYSFRAPGQATAYYFGYSHLQSLRTLVQMKLRDRFDQQAFHDFLLAQGLLPPELLRPAVMDRFVAPRLAEAKPAAD